jgi:polyhydroxybutyrate depolymerase
VLLKNLRVILLKAIYGVKRFYLAVFLLVFHCLAISQEKDLQGGQLYSSNFLIDGIQRDFIYYIPLNYQKSTAHALVIFLHDDGGTAKGLINSYGNIIQTLADSTDAVVIYPNAVGGHWNDKTEGSPATDTINDVGFISITIDYFKQVYSCDPTRVYVAGLFNGGKLAQRLTCDIPSKITAVAPFVSDDFVAKCNADNSVSIMNTNGLIDSSNKKLSKAAIEEMWRFFIYKVKG